MIRYLAFTVFAAAAWGQSFEVASVRVHQSAVDAPIIKNPGANPIRISGNRVDLQMVTLKDLVMAAYGVKEYQVAKAPEWAGAVDSLFDVSAKTSGSTPPTTEQVRPMLQALLAERFKLKIRRESKQLSVYNLTVATAGPNATGPKLKAVAEGAPPTPNMRRGSMEQIAALLSLFLDRPVIDKTGLTGVFDYSARLAELDVNAPDSAEVIARTLTAIQDQLGLRAEPGKATLEMLVVESAQKPSGN